MFRELLWLARRYARQQATRLCSCDLHILRESNYELALYHVSLAKALLTLCKQAKVYYKD
jgi:hypothetical protein